MSIALVADAANQSKEGKLNILGAFDTLFTKVVPTVHPSMVLVVRLSATSVELGTERKFAVVIWNPDGKELGRTEMKFKMEGDTLVGHSDVILNLNNVTFPDFGEYCILILINDEEKARVPIYVKEKSQ